MGYGDMFSKMLNQNDQYEIAEGYYNDMDVMLPAKVWQPIDTKKLKEWDKVTNLTKTGKLTPEVERRPRRRALQVSLDRRERQQDQGAVAIHQHGAGLAQCRTRSATTRRQPAAPIESWGELLNKDFKGKVALLNVPQIGVMDAAMAIEALGLKKFVDKGNMTKAEIDFLIDYLIPLKKAGHFRAFWENFGQSVNLMVNGEVALESMWSPAVAAIQAEGVPCVYAFPKEGMRGWHGGLAISAKVKGKQLDQAYEYINWWLDGWAGAFVARQGYYHSIPDNAKKYLEPVEWDYWYDGKPAAKDLVRSVRHRHHQEGRRSLGRFVLEPLLQDQRLEFADGRERLSR